VPGLGGFPDRRCVSRIILVRLDERLHELGCDEPPVVAHDGRCRSGSMTRVWYPNDAAIMGSSMDPHRNVLTTIRRPAERRKTRVSPVA